MIHFKVKVLLLLMLLLAAVAATAPISAKHDGARR